MNWPRREHPSRGFPFGRCRPVYRLPPSPSESPGSLVGFRFCRLDYFKFSVKNVGLRCGFVPTKYFCTWARRSRNVRATAAPHVIGAAGIARRLFFIPQEISLSGPCKAAFGGFVAYCSRTQRCCYLSMSLAPPAPPPLRGAFLRSAGKLPQRCLGDLRCSSGRAPAGVFTMLDGGLIVTLMLSAGAIAFAVLALRPGHKGGRASTR